MIGVVFAAELFRYGSLPKAIAMNESEQFNALHEFIRNAGPDGWMDYADELKEAANLLWDQADQGRMLGIASNSLQGQTHRIDKPSVSRTFILLSGLALENILKGLAVSQSPGLISSGELDGKIKTHKLTDLVDLCNGLTLSPEDLQICRIAQEAIPYWGRYPVPRSFHVIKPEQVADLDYHDRFNALYDRVHKQLYDAIKDGWDSGVGTKLESFRSSRYESEMQAEIDRINKCGNKDS